MSDVAAAVALAVQARVPVLLWGAPGVGKSETIRTIGRVLGLPVETVVASVREPSDFAGLPVIVGGAVRFAPPRWAQRLAEAGKGLLFLDEISTAPPATQAALLRVVLERVVGDLELPLAVAIVAAANPPEQAAGGWDMSAALANRFCHLYWKVIAGVWVDGMLSGWPTPAVRALPSGWEAEIPGTRALVAAFIRARPHLLLQVPKEDAGAGRAWPSPRSWDMAARLMAACRAGGADSDTEAQLVSGCVGDGTGFEFLAWRRELDLPDPESLLADPSQFRMPSRGDQAFAVLAAVVAAAVERLNAQRWTAAWQILARAAEQGATDIAASAARRLAEARKPGMELKLPTKEIVPALRAFTPVLQAAGLMK